MLALLAEPFVDATDAVYALVRHHEPELARTAADLFGYRLEVGATAARLSGPPTAAGLRRSIRIRPASVTGRARPTDEWPALSDRAAVLLFLTLAALERGGAQVAIADLARAAAAAGADAEPPISVDFDAHHERVAFADGLDLLVAWGVLAHTAGTRASYQRREQDEHEALLTVDRRRLAYVLRDPVACAAATSLDDVAGEPHRYTEHAEGERRARAHRLARRLVEDPAVLIDEPDEQERTYFLGQRARLEEGVADATGLEVERRAEGSAVILEDRRLTDIAFPTNASTKQLALLVCDVLAGLASDEELAAERLRATVAELLRTHQQHWQRDPHDADLVRALSRDVAQLLEALGLAAATPRGGLRPRPPCARYRNPDVQRTQTTT